MRDSEALRRDTQKAPSTFWSQLNDRAGAMIARVLLDTAVTPNMVSVAGSISHLAGAALVLAAPVAPPVWLAVAVFLAWELALSLDCADGQLARARRSPTAFGAWLDQVLDFVNHTAVIVSLTIFSVRAFDLPDVTIALLGGLAVAGNLIGLFATSQRNSLLGTAPALDPATHPIFRVLLRLLHLTDYGAFLAVASLGLLLPAVLVAALILSPAFTAASVGVQVAINWPAVRAKLDDSAPAAAVDRH